MKINTKNKFQIFKVCFYKCYYSHLIKIIFSISFPLELIDYYSWNFRAACWKFANDTKFSSRAKRSIFMLSSDPDPYVTSTCYIIMAFNNYGDGGNIFLSWTRTFNRHRRMEVSIVIFLLASKKFFKAKPNINTILPHVIHIAKYSKRHLLYIFLLLHYHEKSLDSSFMWYSFTLHSDERKVIRYQYLVNIPLVCCFWVSPLQGYTQFILQIYYGWSNFECSETSFIYFL